MIPVALRRVVHRAALLYACLAVLPLGAANADVGADVRKILGNQRRILVLREAANLEDRAESRRAGQYLFFHNQQLGRKLVDDIAYSQQGLSERYQEMIGVLDAPDYGDEDRLIFRSILEALLRKLPPQEHDDASQRLERLANLRKTLGVTFESAFQRIPLKSSRPHSGRWEAYLAQLSQAMPAKQVLEELEHELISAPEPAISLSEAAERARVLEWNGEELQEKTLLLTFDDGPHSIHTLAILDILKMYGVHAVFFQVGRNLGLVDRGVAIPGHNQQIVSRLLLEGHAIGNHSFTHPVLPKLDDQKIEREIADTQTLIDAMIAAGDGRTGGFRAPYGARNDKVLAQIDKHHLRSIVWNIDSEDWADPVPASIAHRVVQEAEKAGRGIVLMHDIHARTVDALPLVIRELGNRGFRFARWNGQKLVLDPDSKKDAPP